MATLRELLAYVPHIPGNVPLNYIAQFWSVHALGYSTFSGRLPSAIFSVLACAGVFTLARRMEIRWPLFAAALFALFPLQLRYALEARPYELALCISIWTTVAFLRVLESPASWTRAALYFLAIAAGLYAFPFTIFVPGAHLAWLLFTRQWKLLLRAGGAALLAAAAFAPWYLHSAELWRQSVSEGLLRESITWRALPMILRELTGAGYIGTGLVLLGAAFGLAQTRQRGLWLFSAVTPLVCAVAADAVFGYFLAIRQMIFVLTPLALLCALGVEALWERHGKSAGVLMVGLCTAMLIGNVSFYSRPRENWRTAATILSTETCVRYAPEDSRQLYAFFLPELAQQRCTPQDWMSLSRVALAVSPYAANNPVAEIQKQLAAAGFVKAADVNEATPRVELYRRR